MHERLEHRTYLAHVERSYLLQICAPCPVLHMVRGSFSFHVVRLHISHGDLSIPAGFVSI